MILIFLFLSIILWGIVKSSRLKAQKEIIILFSFLRLLALTFLVPVYFIVITMYADFHGTCEWSFRYIDSCTRQSIIAIMILVPLSILYLFFTLATREDIGKDKKLLTHYRWSNRIALIPFVVIFLLFLLEVLIGFFG